MGWWFGRKSAPADARPFVPAWLTDVGEEEGFARSVEGQGVYVKTQGEFGVFRSGAWEFGIVRGTKVMLGVQQVIGVRASAVATPSGGSMIDAEARSAIASILAAMRQHGLIAP